MTRLSELHPIVYHLRIKQKRLARHLGDRLKLYRFAQQQQPEPLAFCCKKHQSLLRRRLGSSDPRLQESKVINLQIAHQSIDGLLIQPGEVFSFWHRVGPATANRGYVEGLQLSRGEVRTGIGGGLCQLANLLYWMALHTPLEILERHHHSFDPFPDDHRVLPFGSGASVFYNYIDLRFYNPTAQTFQLRVWLTDAHLKGAICSNAEYPYSFHVYEKNHRFFQQNQKNYRENEIWRSQINRRTGNIHKEELLIQNLAEVKYSLEAAGLQR